MHDEPVRKIEIVAFYFMIAVFLVVGIAWESIALAVRYKKSAVFMGVVGMAYWLAG